MSVAVRPAPSDVVRSLLDHGFLGAGANGAAIAGTSGVGSVALIAAAGCLGRVLPGVVLDSRSGFGAQVSRSIVTDVPMWLFDRDSLRSEHPLLARTAPDATSLAIIPARDDGAAIGALAVTWSTPHPEELLDVRALRAVAAAVVRLCIASSGALATRRSIAAVAGSATVASSEPRCADEGSALRPDR